MRINNDNVVNAICIFAIVVSICFMLTVMLKSFYGEQIEISFIKDIFSIGATLFAALIAISLFNDWKDQHNKIIESNSASELINSILQTKVQLRHIRILLDNSELNNHMINSEISKIFDTFVKNNESFQEQLEFFNLLLKKGPKKNNRKKHDDFLSKARDLVNSFGNIVKLKSATQNVYIEYSPKFILLVDKHLIECDNFCDSWRIQT
ncbi:hypothetical protein I6M89_04365 [Acinetobacter pittii]|nr:hypothetical protein [Acinetobacter pittii]